MSYFEQLAERSGLLPASATGAAEWTAATPAAAAGDLQEISLETPAAPAPAPGLSHVAPSTVPAASAPQTAPLTAAAPAQQVTVLSTVEKNSCEAAPRTPAPAVAAPLETPAASSDERAPSPAFAPLANPIEATAAMATPAVQPPSAAEPVQPVLRQVLAWIAADPAPAAAATPAASEPAAPQRESAIIIEADTPDAVEPSPPAAAEPRAPSPVPSSPARTGAPPAVIEERVELHIGTISVRIEAPAPAPAPAAVRREAAPVQAAAPRPAASTPRLRRHFLRP
ncbi:hypothetical protein [Plasticicumulans acidivorans]|uniref:Uncharacterized protein n=1 Tax=Plasticicumulans acidivorans TaxID=886464 RepID=A0A317MU78_9GAMM|nr:hypothetical protein [Plasticicumulans acidivorans]PWV61204.1 hypothetical protein C7443_106218 [Plasticicumulans acidivorans]